MNKRHTKGVDIMDAVSITGVDRVVPPMDSTAAWREHAGEIAKVDAAIAAREIVRNGLLADIEAERDIDELIADVPAAPAANSARELDRVDAEISRLRTHRESLREREPAVRQRAGAAISHLREPVAELQAEIARRLVGIAPMVTAVDRIYREAEAQGYPLSALGTRVVHPHGLHLDDLHAGQGRLWSMIRELRDEHGIEISTGEVLA